MAKQVTLRGIDDRLDRALRDEATRRGRSLNRTVLDLLEEATGLAEVESNGAVPARRFHDLDHLIGTWSTEEADEFDRYLKESRRIDDELWR
jgi:plasmid stability protein